MSNDRWVLTSHLSLALSSLAHRGTCSNKKRQVLLLRMGPENAMLPHLRRHHFFRQSRILFTVTTTPTRISQSSPEPPATFVVKIMDHKDVRRKSVPTLLLSMTVNHQLSALDGHQVSGNQGLFQPRIECAPARIQLPRHRHLSLPAISIHNQSPLRTNPL